MSDLGCREAERSLGVLAVGALDPADRAGVDSHLAQCPRCRSTLAELRDVTDLMGLVTAGSAELAATGSPVPRPAVPAPPPAGRRRHPAARRFARGRGSRGDDRGADRDQLRRTRRSR